MARLKGIEPPHLVPETSALSTELQAHIDNKSNYRGFQSKNQLMERIGE
jgi:hypothetical protein